MFRKALIWICLFAFLPSALGCSTKRTMAVDSDPADGSPVQFDEPIHVEGYTLRDGTWFTWSGSVVKATPDSLEFRSSSTDHLKKGATFGSAGTPVEERPLVFRLAATEVVELHVVKGKLVPSLLLAILGLVTLAAVSLATNGGMDVLGD